ncbi:hypothetical protein B9Z55_001942 [Caenorhabditis nigoni]|uniref:Uncharacterized protein n=1 Tax=Caenorhabditis nigoni TaxID=1611254 RepID=A0A2G5VI46_9PELO|nr:hypothetical protein B9Z55_001942 [Caenorhabditis nigoni]
MKTSATTPSSGLSEEGSKHVNIVQRRAASSPTSTDADAMNGRSTLPKATLQHGRQPDQITNGTWNFEQRRECKNIINDLYAVMDEQSPEAAARRRSLQIASQTTTRRSSRSLAHILTRLQRQEVFLRQRMFIGS